MTRSTDTEHDADTLPATILALRHAQARIEALEARRTEPVAIVGMACRLPGGADDPGALWDLLCRGTDTSGPVPADRWPADRFYNAATDVPGQTHAARAHFLRGAVGDFDAPFFGISAKEALSLDPQQRLLLELGWEALEDAGLDPAALRGSRTGVFVGISSDDYAQAHRHSGRLDLIDGYALTGTCFAPAAGRISYSFGFEGPSLAVDTACSSSLVAVHLACESLRGGESDLALAAGVNLILSPIFHIASTKLGTISPDGLCKTFDASANGYGRGEGCGMVVLKRLADAEAAGDRVLALIRGSAVNQDGRSNGLTAPNGLAQERVIREALGRAGLLPGEIDYIEVHGTGTALGDPIEVEAIGRVMAGRAASRPVLLGTVKSNIGHLEAASGIAGLIRAVQCLRHGEIPPHLHLATPSPHIPWGRFPFAVCTRRTDWPASGGPRRAGVSSFGFSGTNAHVVLESAPDAGDAHEATPPEALLLPLSARTPEALMALAGRWRDWLAAPGDRDLAAACATAGAGRTHMARRLAVTGRMPEDFTAALGGILEGTPGRSAAVGAASEAPPVIAGLFTGQGSQYPGMGRGLYDSEPVFRDTIDACDAALGDRLGRRLTALLYGEDASEAALRDTAVAQPAIFAVELAAYRLWESWGVVPAVVCGHSIGEYVAAHVAGIIPFADAVALVAERGRLMGSLPSGGAMAALCAAEAVVLPLLRPGDGVSIAAVNTPGDVVVSGPQAAVADLLRRLATVGIGAQPLRVSHAFHSASMRPIVPAFRAFAAKRRFGTAAMALVSTVTGAPIASDELADPRYWSRQIEAPVRFADAAAALAASGAGVLLDYGPSPVLAGLARQCMPGADRLFLGSLRPGGDDRAAMLDSLARLYAKGAEIDWAAVTRARKGRRTTIPSYPFQRKTYYRAPIVEADAPASPVAPPAHPYLGQRIRSRLLPEGATLYQALFSAEQPAFLREHQIFERIISPAAAHLSMAFAAADGRRALEDVAFTAPLVIDAATPRLVQLAVASDASYSLVSRAAEATDERWTVHCAGRIAVAEAPPAALDLAAVRARCPGRAEAADFYALIGTLGYSTGDGFRCIREIAKGDGEALCRVEASRPFADDCIDPGLIDSLLQTVLPACEAEAAHLLDGGSVLVPLHIGRITRHASLARPLLCHARVALSGEIVTAQIAACDETGAAVLTIADFLLKRTDRATLYQEMHDDDDGLIQHIAWRPFPAPAASDEPTRWIVFAQADGWGDALADHLRARGDDVLDLRRAEHDPSSLERTVRPWLARGSGAVTALFAWHGDGADPVADCTAVGAVLPPVLRALAGAASPVRLWLLTRQAQTVVPEDGVPPSLDGGMLWGLGRAVAREMPELWGGLVDVEARPSATSMAALIGVVGGTPGEHEVVIRRGGQLFAARLVAFAADGRRALPGVSDGEGYVLDKGPRRTLDDLRFERRARWAPGAGEIEIEVLAAGLNFRDVLNALGQYPGKPGMLGFEAVGVVTALGAGVDDLALGDGVIALAAPGCIGSHLTTARVLVARKPAALTAAAAVSLPAALLTAYWALHHLGGIRRGDRVLIHAAAGGVGLAAVQLALAAGAEVFATAGTPEKRAHLRAMGVVHVMSSRTTAFEQEILATTQGRGVDMVLNSLTGAFIDASFAVLAPGGRFLEMGKIGIWDEARVRARDPSWRYHPFDLAAVALERPGELLAIFERLLADVAAGRLRALPTTVFPMEAAQDAFRFMAQARHIGKIVLSREEEHARSLLRAGGIVRADAAYLVTGGLGALGLRVARWLVEEGARELVLAGRGAPGETACAAIAELERGGAVVTVVRGDVASAADVARMVAASTRPLRGVIHAAGVLEDGMIADLDAARLARIMAPKVAGAWHLHEATRELDLDHFVLFSSIAAIIGNLGQGGYAAANAFMDGLAAHRRRLGLPATSIAWGPWAEAGMAATMATDRFSAQGILPLAPARALRALGSVLAERPAQAVVAAVDWRAYAVAHGLDGSGGLFADLASAPPASQPAAAARTEAPAARDIVAELRAAPPPRRPELMRRYLQDLARQTLGYGDSEPIAPDQALVDQGFDSLMSVDMRNRLNRGLGVTLPASLLFDYPTLERIGRHLLATVIAVSEPAGDAALADLSTAALLDEIERLTG